MTTRRTFIGSASLALAWPVLSRVAWAQDAETGLATSGLIYVTPLKSDGAESRCKAEIWFAYHDGACFVVTPPDAWRARAVAQGLNRARLWVGEFGIWTRADDAFRQAPELMATASLETDAGVHAAVLDIMGGKYAEDGWRRYGPQFRAGLQDGARVMIRYAIDA